jgi:hypothetical protein
MKDFFAFLQRNTKTPIRSSFIFSFLASTLLIIVIFGMATITSAIIGKENSQFVLSGLGTLGIIAIIVLYVFFTLGIWLFVSTRERSDAEDIFTWVRRLMVASWEVSYPLTVPNKDKIGGAEGQLLTTFIPRVSAQVYIDNTTQKLEIRFVITDNRIWANRDQIIDLIAIRNVLQDQFAMIYYYKGKRDLSTEARTHILPEIQGTNIDSIEVEVFGSLEFAAKRNEPITRMEGQWFDLNGNVRRVLAIMTEVDKQGHEYQAKMSDVQLDTQYFTAMGKLVFNRIG